MLLQYNCDIWAYFMLKCPHLRDCMKTNVSGGVPDMIPIAMQGIDVRARFAGGFVVM